MRDVTLENSSIGDLTANAVEYKLGGPGSRVPMFASRCPRRCARANGSIPCVRAHRMSIGDATFCFLEPHVGFRVRTVMISSFVTDNDFESMALEAHAPVKIGRCDRVASVRTRAYQTLGSTTSDTGGNAP